MKGRILADITLGSAHCNAGGARRPQHQELPLGNLLRGRTSLASSARSSSGLRPLKQPKRQFAATPASTSPEAEFKREAAKLERKMKKAYAKFAEASGMDPPAEL